MRTRVWVLASFLLSASVATASAAESVMGFWAGEDSILEVRSDGVGLSMVIVAMLNPLYLEDEEVGVAGEPRVDLNNPDESLRTRPIMGMDLLSGYRYEDGRWQGKIYDPQSGKVYSSRMQVNDDGELEMRGYIGAPMFGRTQTFDPAGSCQEHIVLMLADAEIEEVC